MSGIAPIATASAAEAAVKREARPARLTVLLVALLLLLSVAGCGTGGNGSDKPAQVAAGSAGSEQMGAFQLFYDDYGVSLPTLLHTSDNAVCWSLWVAIAQTATDPDFRTILRIDIPKTEAALRSVCGRTLAIGTSPSYDRFPGTFYIFNGHRSTMKEVDSGTISFSSAADGKIAIRFDIGFTDHGSKILPSPHYRLKGEMLSLTGTGSLHISDAGRSAKASGEEIYKVKCSGCHSLGSYHRSSANSADLAERGGELPLFFTGTVAAHEGVALTDQEMEPLRVWLNAW